MPLPTRITGRVALASATIASAASADSVAGATGDAHVAREPATIGVAGGVPEVVSDCAAGNACSSP